MKILIDNVIRIIDGVNQPLIQKYCKNNLEIDNPQYAQNERLGFPTYNIPRRLYWYEKRGNDYILPFGCLKDIYTLYPQKELYVLNYNKPTPLIYKSNIKLFDYQELAKNKALKSKNGVIVMPAGCLVGDTKIRLNSCKKGFQTTLEKAYKSWNGLNKSPRNNFQHKDNIFIRGLRDNKVGLNKVIDIIYSGKKEVFELELQDGKKVQLTKEHKVYTKTGYVEAQYCLNKEIAIDNNIKAQKLNIKENKKNKIRDSLISVSSNHPFARVCIDKRRKSKCKSYRIPLHRAIYEMNLNGFKNLEDYKKALKENIKNMKFVNTKKYCIHHIDFNHYNNNVNNLKCITYEEHRKIHSQSINGNSENFNQGTITYSKCISIKKIGIKDTYDICCENKYQSFTANDIIVHNSGKTQTALQLISELRLKTLWVTHTYDLLNQSYDRAKDNLEDVGLGKIAAGKIDIGTHITFATVQTLCKLDLSEFKNEWDCIVVDEGHRVCGTPAQLGMFYKVINALSCRYKYALTATPFRNIKGTEKALFSLIGPIICEISKEVVAEKTIKAKVIPVYTDFKIPRDAQKSDGTIDYSKLTTFLSENEERNDIILDILKECKDNYTLLLGDRLTQLQYLQEKIGYGVKIDGTMTTKKKKQQREQYIQDMRDGKENLLFATYGLAKEGLDIPRLDRLILASPHRDKATIIQSVGRIERKFEGKKNPIVYDIVDNTQFHQNMFKSRKTIYKKNGNILI